DAAHTIRVQETASKSNYQSVSQNSSQTAVVDQIVNTAAPTLSGYTHVGQVLTATGGTWTPAGTSSAYQWLQCDSSGGSCASIGGATATTSTLVAGDAAHTIRVQETASKTNYQSLAQNSSQTAVIDQIVNTAAPTISGNTHVGQT